MDSSSTSASSATAGLMVASAKRIARIEGEFLVPDLSASITDNTPMVTTALSEANTANPLRLQRRNRLVAIRLTRCFVLCITDLKEKLVDNKNGFIQTPYPHIRFVIEFI